MIQGNMLVAGLQSIQDTGIRASNSWTAQYTRYWVTCQRIKRIYQLRTINARFNNYIKL